MKSKCPSSYGLSLLAFLAATQVGCAVQYVLTVQATDAIFLAGRSDVVIPDASDPWTGPAGGFLGRHGGPTPEEAKETFPGFISVVGSDVVKVADPAVGGINFFNGLGPPYFGPEGNNAVSSLSPLGDLSGYIGNQGALAAVFLNDNIPNGASPPATMNFGTAASRDFLSLSPGLGQVFFVGDGMTSGGTLQEFIAPAGATRLYFGIPDGFGFNGPPGAYDDNDGSYRISVGVNELPPNSVPDGGSSLILLGLGALGVCGSRRWISNSRPDA